MASSSATHARHLVLPVFSVLVVDIAYGVSPVLVRLYALGHSNPVFFSFLRVTCAIPVLFLASAVCERGQVTRPTRLDEVIRLAIVGESVACIMIHSVVLAISQ